MRDPVLRARYEEIARVVAEHLGRGAPVESLMGGETDAAKLVSTDAHPLCAVCDMDVNPATAPKSVYKGKTYYFCMDDHKQLFDKSPDKYIEAS